MKNKRPSSLVKTSVLFVFFAFSFLIVNGQAKNNKQPGKSVKSTNARKEQTAFSSEGKIASPIKIPQDVLKQLSEYEDGQLKKCQQDKSIRQSNAANHFAASKLNLNGDNQPDLIIQAQTLCFMGAHNTTFWIFTRKNSSPAPGYQLDFDISVDFLKILKTSHNGYRDIETSSHTAVELYTINWKFDGQKYQKSECRITDENNKVSKVDCNP